MMQPDTPLAEVAHHLPKDAACLLMKWPDEVIEHVLKSVRACYVYWEQGNITLDPVQVEGVVNALVAYLTAYAGELEALRIQNRQLQSQLAGAELLIKGLATTVKDLGGSDG